MIDACDAVARGLWFGRDNGDLFSKDAIEKRGFAHIGGADKSDKAGQELH
jgi:hypothetical protein